MAMTWPGVGGPRKSINSTTIIPFGAPYNIMVIILNNIICYILFPNDSKHSSYVEITMLV